MNVEQVTTEGGYLFLDNASRKIHVYDLKGSKEKVERFKPHERYDRVFERVLETALDHYVLEPVEGKVILHLRPEGMKTNEETLKDVTKILEEHNLKPHEYSFAIRAFLGFPPQPRRKLN